MLGEYCAVLSLSGAASASLGRALQAALSATGGEEAEAAALAAAGIKSLGAEDVRSLLARGPHGELLAGVFADGGAAAGQRFRVVGWAAAAASSAAQLAVDTSRTQRRADG